MNRNDIEEKNAKCNLCGGGLSYLENLFYGNRCVFCAEKIHNVKFIPFLRMAIVDWKIYQVLIAVKKKMGDETRARYYYQSVLGVNGYKDLNESMSITIKYQILKELKDSLK